MSASDPEPVKIRHPPHTRRAAQYAREQAAAKRAGRRRLVAVVIALVAGALVATRPVLAAIVVVAVVLGLVARRTLLGALPDKQAELGSSRAPRRSEAVGPSGPPAGLVLALAAAAVIAATLWVAHLVPVGTPAAFWSGFWGDTGVEHVLVAVAFWPPLRWILWIGGLLFAGTIRRMLFQRRVRTVAVGEVRDPDDE